MSDAHDIPRLRPVADEGRPPPVMPSACQAGGCGGGPPQPAPVFPSFGEVRVNGVEIDPDEIAREIQHHPSDDPEAAWKAAAQALAIRELLLQEADRRGIAPAPEADAAGRQETEDDSRIRRLLEETVSPALPTEEDCRRFYESRLDRFRTPDLFEAAHILIEPDGRDAGAWASAEAEARALIFAIGDDPGVFAAAARDHSACPSSRQDGSLGQVRRGELEPAVQRAIEATPEGRTAREPVRSRHGWHVVRLHRRIEGGTAPFEAMRSAIADMLEARGWSLAAARVVAELAEGAEIEGVAVTPEAA